MRMHSLNFIPRPNVRFHKFFFLFALSFLDGKVRESPEQMSHQIGAGYPEKLVTP